MAKPAAPPLEHRFGPFTYDSVQRLLFRAGEPVPLVPKLTDTLHVLLERRGRLVEKNELIQLVWPDAVVEESGLVRNISLLRKALGDESEEYIQTIPKRGYRFAAPEPESPQPEVRPRRWLRRAVAVTFVTLFLALAYWQFFAPGRLLSNSGQAEIAVLPFEVDATAHTGTSRALQESLVTALAQIPGIRVLSPATIRRYESARVPQHVMTRILGMDAVLEGMVAADGGINTRLVDVRSGRIIWAKRYDRPAAVDEPVYPAVANRIAKDVEPHLTTHSNRK